MNNNEQYFIINKMYAGSYLDENDAQNIGHEVINLFSDDNGDNYIYINKGGVIPAKYNDKVSYVILTKQYSKGCQEVLGIAKVGEQMVKESVKQTDESIDKQAGRYKDKIRYAGQTLPKIFKNNFYGGSVDRFFDNPVITFKTEKFYFPRASKHILIADEDSPINESTATIYRLPSYKFGHQSLRFYFSNQKGDKTEPAFQKLSEMILDEESFEERKPDIARKTEIEKYGKDTCSYLEIMGKIDSENIFSNLLCYFLKTDWNLLRKFCKGLSKDIDISEEQLKIEREKHGRTDIWIEDKDNVIVIENKITAGLSRPDQLQDYKKEAEEEAGGRKVHCFLIAPNRYSKINLDENGECDGFKMVKYSEIHHIFKNHEALDVKGEDNEYISKLNLYYDDFMRALSIHGDGNKTAKQESMERLFYRRLYQLSKKSR